MPASLPKDDRTGGGCGDVFRVFGTVHKVPVVLCPGCRKPMKPGQPKPLAARSMVEIAYVCELCGASTKRMLKADEVRSKAQGK